MPELILPSFLKHLKTLTGYLCSKSGQRQDSTARTQTRIPGRGLYLEPAKKKSLAGPVIFRKACGEASK
jgi:hypothetical protein